MNYELRYEKLQSKMKQADLDVVAVISPQNTIYFSGTYIMTQADIPDRLAITLVPAEGDPIMIACVIEKATVDQEVWFKEKKFYVEFQQSPIDLFVETLKEWGLMDGRIGIETNYLTADYFIELKEKAPRIQISNCKRIFDEIRMVKDEDEIHCMREVAHITRIAVEEALKEVQPGVTERAFANLAKTKMLNNQAVFSLDFFVMGYGNNSCLVHKLPDSTVMERGDIMRLDCGCVGGGHYQSDLARTVLIGEVDAKLLETNKKLNAVYEETVAMMRPGVKASDVFGACIKIMEKYGLPANTPHIGHSLGLECHEYPMISPVEFCELQEGMVINIEPIFVLDGRLYHTEDLVLVTKNGTEMLSTDKKSPGILRIQS